MVTNKGHRYWFQPYIKSTINNAAILVREIGIKISKKLYETEASGGITLKNIKKIATTGVDRISIGQLTHSVAAIDLKLEI